MRSCCSTNTNEGNLVNKIESYFDVLKQQIKKSLSQSFTLKNWSDRWSEQTTTTKNEDFSPREHPGTYPPPLTPYPHTPHPSGRRFEVTQQRQRPNNSFQHHGPPFSICRVVVSIGSTNTGGDQCGKAFCRKLRLYLDEWFRLVNAFTTYLVLFSHDGDLVVSKFTFYSIDPCSNPPKVNSFVL